MRLFKDRIFSTLAAALVPLFLTSAISSAALAAQYKLYINKGQSASNVIVFEDSMSATVTHTNEGMELTLPGVEVALRCKSSDTNNTTDSCVIAIEPGTTSSSGGSTSGGSTSGGSTSGGSTSGGSTSGGSTSGGDCVVTTWDDCGGSSSGGSTSGGSTSGGSTSGGSTSGGTSSGGSGTCSNTSSVECGSLDYGSGGSSATGNTSRITLSPGVSLALPFTTRVGAYYGKVGIVPTSSGFPVDGSEVRMYWSEEAGGKPLQGDCQATLGQEGAIYWDQSGTLGFGCRIPNQSAKLFLNFRLCISDITDGSCTGPNVKYGSEQASVYVSGSKASR